MKSAEDLLDLVMKNYDQMSTMIIKKQLKDHAKNKNKRDIIDSGFLLKILLEFYRVERKNRYKLLRDAFLSQSSFVQGGRYIVKFHNLKKIL